MMKPLLRVAIRTAKIALISLVVLEILSFLILTTSNYIIYGKMREGSRVVYDPYALFLNQDGQRTTIYNSFEPGDHDIVIWMFGGSTMRGATDFDEKTIPSFLTKNLNEGKRSDLHFTALNFGENSFNSLMETKYLQKIMIEKPEPKPNVILFYDGANECSYFTQYRDQYGHHGYRRVRGLVESYYQSLFGVLKPLNAALYASFTKELYDKIVMTLFPLQADTKSLQEFLDRCEQRYDYLNSLATTSNAVFILVWQPVRWCETDQVAPEVVEAERKHFINSDRFKTTRHNFQVVYGALLERLRNKPYFISFQNVLCARTETTYQPDGVHLTDDGRKRVADAMTRVVVERLGLRQ
jgi:hypothetical protein